MIFTSFSHFYADALTKDFGVCEELYITSVAVAQPQKNVKNDKE